MIAQGTTAIKFDDQELPELSFKFLLFIFLKYCFAYFNFS